MELYDKQIDTLTLQTSPQLEKLGVPHGFTTRTGGGSSGIWESLNLGVNRGDEEANVRENYRRLCAALGVDMGKLVLCRQVHSDTVRTVTAADAGCGLDRRADWEADALITDVPGVTLVAFGADCLTMVLYDPVRKAVGAVHAGWRGTAAGIVERAVERMCDCYGTRPEDLICALGPCIGKCCFETDQDVPNAMTATLGAAALPYLTSDGNGKFHVDLRGLNALRLERAGVLPEHMDLSPDCTMCHPEKYWSHRYTKGQRGSQVGLIALPEGLA